VEGHTTQGANASPGPALRSLRPQTRLDTFCTRTGRPLRRPEGWGPTGEGLGRTARVHVCEESDSGIVLMKHANKDLRRSAEHAEGRPLVKENAPSLHTHPTLSGDVGVYPGSWGVRRAPRRLAAIHPRQEPYALMSARTDPCGGYRVTGIPSASVPSMFDSLRVKVPLTTCWR